MGLILLDRAMLSKSFIQFSVDGWGCVPSLLFTWGQTMVGGFPGSSDGKASAYNVGDPGSIPGLGRSPGEGNGNPLQYSGLENSMDSPWGCKELDTAEQLSLTHSLTNLKRVKEGTRVGFRKQGLQAFPASCLFL